MLLAKKLFLLIFYLFLFAHQIIGQSITDLTNSAVEKGDKYYDLFAYKKAINFYTQAVENQSIDSLRGEIALKIATSYSKLNQPKESLDWFSEANSCGLDLDEVTMLTYGQALTASGEYAKAKDIFQNLLLIDSVGKSIEEISKEQLSAINEQQKFFKNSGRTSIKKVDFNSKYSDFAPYIFDNLILFVSARNEISSISSIFNWDEIHYLDIFAYDTTSKQVRQFSKNINTKMHEGPLTAYNNNTDLIFTRNTSTNKKLKESNDGITKLQLYHSKFSEDKWQAAEVLDFCDPNFSFAHPSISPDGNVLYFASDMPGGYGESDIYKVERDSIGNWGSPVNMGDVINSAGNEFFPTLYGNSLYFASNGHGGLGGLDLFGYDLSQGSLGKVVNLGAPINSSLDDFGLAINETGRSGYFSSNREESAFKDEIYYFKSSSDLLPQYKIQLIVVDQSNEEYLEDCKIHLLNSKKDTISSLVEGKDLYETFNVEPNEQFELVVQKNGYLTKSVLISTLESTASSPNIWKEKIELIKDYDFGFTGYVYNAANNLRLDSVHVKITNNLMDNSQIDLFTDEAGLFFMHLNEYELNHRISFQLKLEKEGFLGKTVTYNKTLNEPGIDTLNNNLNLGLDKIEVGADIGKLVDIEPIYFDLGKSKIRPDAAKELDKIVEVMKENPNMIIELGSHTDARGSDAFNLKLSDKRAKASAEYITSQGISSDRITGKGYGETQLINQCTNGVKCSEEQHQINRRTEFKVIKF